MMIWNEDGQEDVTVTVPDQASLLADLERCFRAGLGFSVATLNLDHVVKLSQNKLFRDAYNAQTHVTADGNPIVWLSRLARQNVSLVPGSTLIDPMAALAAKEGVSVALFGSNNATLGVAARELCARHPGLEIVLCRAPEMGFDPLGAAAEADIAAIEASGAHLCFLALGAPKQELFAARAQKSLAGVGFLSIGAGLDFIAGTQRMAPGWVRWLASEWLWRLLHNPRRLAGRYGACLYMLPGLIGKALRFRRQSRRLS